ncbi:MAG: CoA-binding protein [Paludibacter sp.]
MEFFFNPKGVAVIGATENRLKGGFHLLRNVIESYKGKVYPVNPRYASLMDMPCYPDVASIPDDFDIAVYFIPAPGLYRAIEECASKNVKGIIIESAGFAEVGTEGRKLQEECVLLAHKHGIRLWGPNCMGLLDSRLGHVFSFMYMDDWKTLLKPGNVSMIVQSGMLSAGFLLMVLERGGMAISKMCSIGNKCDVNETELRQGIHERLIMEKIVIDKGHPFSFSKSYLKTLFTEFNFEILKTSSNGYFKTWKKELFAFKPMELAKALLFATRDKTLFILKK